MYTCTYVYKYVINLHAAERMLDLRQTQPYITENCLFANGSAWPCLGLKAHTGRLYTAFVAVCLLQLFRAGDGDDAELYWATEAAASLAEWLRSLEEFPRYLTAEQAQTLWDLHMAMLATKLYIYMCTHVMLHHMWCTCSAL